MNHVSRPQPERIRRKPARRGCFTPWVLISASVVVLIMVVTTPLWLPGLINAVVPDRYIAAYFPEPLQRMIQDTNPLQILPTAEPVDEDVASALLEGVGQIEVTATVMPTIDNGETTTDPAEALTPASDVTPTPAFVDPGGSGPADQVMLSGFQHSYQLWNNCGPATLATALSYWGVIVDQRDVAAFVKPNIEDRNVRPEELQAFVQSRGLEMLIRVDGDVNLLRRLIDAGYPVIIEKGFNPEPDRLGWMGHYLLIYGYADSNRTFYTMDSYLGPGQQEPYDHIDQYWQHFNRTYLVIYPSEQAGEVAGIIGDEMDDFTMYNNAIATAQAEIQADENNPFGWFNLGSSLVGLGDYENAAVAFDLARSKGTPWRMLWYQFGPYEAYLNVGGDRLTDVIALAASVLADNEYSEEAYYYRGLALSLMGDTANAINDFNRALKYNPNFTPAQQALNTAGGGS